MTRYLVVVMSVLIIIAAITLRARRCADLAEDCWAPWRDCYCDRLSAELGMTERCRR